MQSLDKILKIKYPVILAPMFLVTSVEMIKIALDSGITGAIPAMNFRKENDLKLAIKDIKKHSDKAFGINLITNRSNTKYKKQLKAILDSKPDFVISSLGNPKDLIKEAKKLGIKVFCDIVNLEFAKKVEDLGADAIIAVNSSAGGHSGIIERDELISQLVNNCKIPIINAGGVSANSDLNHVMSLGVAGASVGTIFMASHECHISDDYKQALIKYGKDDIVLTRKLSGVPSSVINTEYVKKIGTKPNILELLVKNNTFLKKHAKHLITNFGMKKLEKAAFSATYKNFWVASKAIENIKEIQNLSVIIKKLVQPK
ncbi:MAG: nitronate monooxygenase [Bacteroidales bacterium]|jgi:nitronate monooxygenase|nr:nitronate monooxygenase [Bacteroidales bacterium]MCK9499818.1 nitronate monooxygenase [Bacteroidales bacterium]MDY0316039.1 nitronate monooxygenase [Bacteroidales bacterium]NLB85919.1 nitronate monooxygenase [Bacteroidales bacterium]